MIDSDDGVIEFSCPACGVGLEMPDDAIGEEVDCPDCDALITVPAVSLTVRPESASKAVGRDLLPSESRIVDAQVDEDLAAAVVSEQPYPPVCVVCGADRRGSEATCHCCGTPFQIDLLRMRQRPRGIFVGEILQTSAKLFMSRLGALVPGILVEALVALALYLTLARVMFFGVRFQASVTAVVGVTLIYCIYHALHVGHFRFMFAIARGESVEPHRLIWPTSGRAYVWPSLAMISVSTMFWAAVSFGMLFGIVPAVVFALLAWPCGRIVVDRGVPPGLAISQAVDLTVPHWPGVLSLTSLLFAFYLAVGLIAVGIGQVLAPLLILCLVVPFSSLALTVTYMRLGDEPTIMDQVVDRQTSI